MYLCVVDVSCALRVWRRVARSCPSIPASTASSSSDSEGYLNVLRRRCVAAVSAPRSFSMFLLRHVRCYVASFGVKEEKKQVAL